MLDPPQSYPRHTPFANPYPTTSFFGHPAHFLQKAPRASSILHPHPTTTLYPPRTRTGCAGRYPRGTFPTSFSLSMPCKASLQRPFLLPVNFSSKPSMARISNHPANTIPTCNLFHLSFHIPFNPVHILRINTRPKPTSSIHNTTLHRCKPSIGMHMTTLLDDPLGILLPSSRVLAHAPILRGYTTPSTLSSVAKLVLPQ